MVSTRKTSVKQPKSAPFSPEKWIQQITDLYSADQVKRINEAARLALDAHDNQLRASGEAYSTHVFKVAEILVDLRLDEEAIIAALLHDVVEDTEITLDDINTKFGEQVGHLVDGVTKMELVNHPGEKSSKTARRVWDSAESLRKMLLAMVEDVRVILIKLADRLHNMRTLSHLSTDKQQRIAEETMAIYAPLANRLGIWQIKWELEDLSFRYLNPEKYIHIAKLLTERRLDREAFIDNVMAILQAELDKTDIQAELSGRPKHIYSIWKKMEGKGIDFHDIFDVSAVRVLVDNIADCYAVLGIVHTLWQHIPKEFDDYIATPKGNNYQSLHTAVVGPGGKTLEVQIRTHEMHERSELGVASHWRYKEGSRYDPGYEQKIAWLRQLLEWQDEDSTADDFVDRFKSEVFEDRVYVITPKGNVVDLSSGATPLDFAYHIHTEIGHRCRGAKINGKIVPLTYTLKTGDQVEVLTTKTGTPSRDWLNTHLNYLKTSRARAKVRAWFTQQDTEKNIRAGKNILDKELSRLGYNTVNQDSLAERLGFKNSLELAASLGKGNTTLVQIAEAGQSLLFPASKDEEFADFERTTVDKDISGDIKIYGVGNLLTSMARCCKPAPGDEIIGYITKGRGITIHRADCSNRLRLASERLIDVAWNHQQQSTYPVDIAILAYDRQGLLRDITAVMTDEKVNVVSMNTLTDSDDHQARMKLTVEVDSIQQLSRLLSKLAQLSNVLEVKRIAAGQQE